MVKWTLQVLALWAAEEHLSQFWQYSCSLCDHASDLDESVQVRLAQITNLVFDGQVADSNENGVILLFVVWIDLAYKFKCHLVQNGKHERRFLSKPDGGGWMLVTEVLPNNLQTL